MIPTQAFRLILSLNITSCENHQVETTDGFLSGECKHKRVRDLREHSKPKLKLKWQESIQACSSFSKLFKLYCCYLWSLLLLKLYYCCLHFPHAFTCALLPLLTTSCFNSCFLVVACTLASTSTFLMLFTLFLLWFMISSSYLCYLDLPNKVLTLLLGALSLYCTQCYLALLLNALLLIGSPFMFC